MIRFLHPCATGTYELLNTYSHAGAIADPGHDLTLLAEAQPVLVDVLALMEAVDKDHYEGLKKLVAPPVVAVAAPPLNGVDGIVDGIVEAARLPRPKHPRAS